MRSNLYLIASGLAGYALLLMAQTLFALPSLRAGFLLMDAVVLAGLVRARETRFSTASVFAAGGLLIDVIALVEHGELTMALGASEQVLGLGFAFAMTSLLRRVVVEQPRPKIVRVLVVVAYALATIAVLFKLARIFDSGARGLFTAWVSWFIEVSRSLANAAIAFVLARSLPMGAAKGVGDGPYRMAGEVAPRPPEPVAPFTLNQLQNGEGGLRFYSLAFTFRFASGTLMTALFVAAAVFMRDPEEVGGVFVLQPLLGVVSGALVIFALVQSGRVFDAAHTSSTGAITFLVMATVADVLTLLVDLAAFGGSSSYRAGRTASEILLLELPATGLFGAIALALVVSSFKKVGRTLNEDAVVRRASTIQAMMMMATVGISAIVWTLLTFSGLSHHGGSTKSTGEIVVLLEAAIVFVLITAIGFVHLSLISQVRNAVKKRTTTSS